MTNPMQDKNASAQRGQQQQQSQRDASQAKPKTDKPADKSGSNFNSPSSSGQR